MRRRRHQQQPPQYFISVVQETRHKDFEVYTYIREWATETQATRNIMCTWSLPNRKSLSFFITFCGRAWRLILECVCKNAWQLREFFWTATAIKTFFLDAHKNVMKTGEEAWRMLLQNDKGRGRQEDEKTIYCTCCCDWCFPRVNL